MYEQYTDKQIVEMLKPKLNKCTAQINWDVVTSELDSLWGQMFWGDILKAISIAYCSGYIRSQLGRSFIIGEKKSKKKKAKESVNPFKVGDKVKFLGFNTEDEEALNNRRFYPPVNIVGKVVELGSNYCFVQWPKNITTGNGLWACRNTYLKKITERWIPATKDNVKVGSKVRMIDGEMHNKGPRCFPIAGTAGIVKVISPYNCKVQWPKGTTSENDRWWSKYEYLEVLLCE